MNNQKLWSKDFAFVSAINFFLLLVFYLLVVTIGVHAVDAYGATTSQAGMVVGMFIIGALVGRLYTGRFIEAIGRRRTLFIGIAMFIVASLFYFVQIGIAFLIVNRFLHGVATGMAGTATGTIVAQVIPDQRKAEGIGYFSLSAVLATAIGPFIGLYLSQITTFSVIFTFCLLLGIISLLTAFFLRVPAVEGKFVAKSKGFAVSNFIEPNALPIALITMLLAFCYSSVLSYIHFYAVEIGLVQAASYFFLVYSVAVLSSRPFTGRFMDKKGSNFVMYPAFVLFAVGLFVLSITNSSWILLLSGILIGLGFGNMQSGTQAIAIKLTEPHRMGLATSTFFIFLDAGLGFGPYLLGFLISFTGYQTLYSSLSIVVLATGVLYYFLHGRTEKKRGCAEISESA